jgi:hypothetical protein
MTTITQRISLNVPEADVLAIREAVKVLHEKLVPHLIDLGPEERRTLPKLGDKTVNFVGKAVQYANEYPTIRPAFLDMEEFERDLAAVHLLLGLQRPLSHVMDMLDDSLVLAGSEALSAALACSRPAKSAAHLSVPGAALVADALGRSLPTRGVARSASAPAKPDGEGADGAAAAQ